MSEMTIQNKKMMLAGLFLSKFDRDGLAALGFGTLREAYNSFALAVGGKPSSVKLYMQEFDVQFSTRRKGWRNRPVRPTRQEFIDEFGGLEIDEFVQLIRTQFAGGCDIDLSIGHAAIEAGLKNEDESSFAKRMITGQAAENFFEDNYREVTRFKNCGLQRTTAYGCGFDFKLSPPQEDFLAVEVKGMRTPSGQIQLTEKEFKMAQYLSNRFYLYVVTDFAHSPKPRVIEDPLRSGISFEERAVKSEQRIWVAQIAA